MNQSSIITTFSNKLIRTLIDVNSFYNTSKLDFNSLKE